mmetsp:Transcript_148160/g.369388  ORF Transcript_148160/g.369388 Transcript_148160/m.369388 type:complete len:236 (-) Transcript_148160:178-885(-)
MGFLLGIAVGCLSLKFFEPSFVGTNLAPLGRFQRNLSLRAESEQEPEVVYNYFSQEYALKPKAEKLDIFSLLSDILPWSDSERQALSIVEEDNPAWRDSPFGPSDDVGLRRNFRAIVGAAGGEALALQALRRNRAIILFGERQTRMAGEVLVQELGRQKATEVILKNPGVLTIDPDGLKDNIVSVAAMAEVIDVVVTNGESAKLAAFVFQLAFAASIGKALFDVVQKRLLDGIPS